MKKLQLSKLAALLCCVLLLCACGDGAGVSSEAGEQESTETLYAAETEETADGTEAEAADAEETDTEAADGTETAEETEAEDADDAEEIAADGTEDADDAETESAKATETDGTKAAEETSSEAASQETASGVMYATLLLNVRSGPGTGYEVVGGLKRGDAVTVCGKSGSWYEIEWEGGTAYAAAAYFTTDWESVNPHLEQYVVTPDPDSWEGQILALVNEYRIQNGREALVMDSRAVAVAQLRAEEIAVYFSHERPDGRSCLTAFIDAGYTEAVYAGENIAYGYESPQEVFDAWIESEPHRENILNEAYGRIGICVKDNYYFVQEFAD